VEIIDLSNKTDIDLGYPSMLSFMLECSVVLKQVQMVLTFSLLSILCSFYPLVLSGSRVKRPAVFQAGVYIIKHYQQ